MQHDVSRGGRRKTHEHGSRLAEHLVARCELPVDEDGLIDFLFRRCATHVRAVLRQAVLLGYLTFTVAERAYRYLRHLADDRWYCASLLEGRYGVALLPLAIAEGWGDRTLPADWWEW